MKHSLGLDIPRALGEICGPKRTTLVADGVFQRWLDYPRRDELRPAQSNTTRAVMTVFVEPQERQTNEQREGSGGNTEGGVHPDLGRQAGTLECQRPTLCRLGDLPPQGISC